MDLTPSQVASASFRTVRKGFDPDEVAEFLQQAAKALEDSQQQATAMEARARAAVARLQEVTAAAEQPAAKAADSSAPDSADVVRVSADEAERLLNESRSESEATLDSTREMSAQMLEDARLEARKVSEAERVAAENEVQSLVARREFLVGDVDQLEQFLIEQRERLRTAARQLEAMCERVPAGLGHVHPPALSASDDPPGDDTAEQFRPEVVGALEEDDEDEPAERDPGSDHVEPEATLPLRPPRLPLGVEHSSGE